MLPAQPALLEESPHARVATRRLERALPYLLIAPVITYIVVVLIAPVLIEVYYSFLTREQGTFAYHIVQRFTLDNYIQIFAQRYIVDSLLFTIGISFIIAVGTVVLGEQDAGGAAQHHSLPTGLARSRGSIGRSILTRRNLPSADATHLRSSREPLAGSPDSRLGRTRARDLGHLLDEVEKTCDVAAIVDRGSVVAQGAIHELVRGGPRAIDIVCHNPIEAATLLAAVPGVTLSLIG